MRTGFHTLSALGRHLPLAAGVLLAAAPAHPAALESPLTILRRPENQVAVARALGPGQAGYRFAVLQPLHGDSGGELSLRTAALGEVAVEAGRRYIVGFSDLLWQPLQRAFVRDPEGHRLLAVDGVGAALFDDRAPLRRLLATGPGVAPPPPSRTVKLLLELLDASDRTSHHLAATELQMQPALWEAFDRRRVGRLRRALEGSGGDPYRRFELLQVADGLARIGATGGDWVAAASREALTDLPLAPDFSTHEPALAIFSLQTLAERGTASDAGLVARQLESTHPTVGATAVGALFALAPDEAPDLGRAALASGALNAETRQLLEAHLRRHGD